MHFLIIKRGALGDVVRTSYFASALKRTHGASLHLSWITAETSVPLLKFNPNIDNLWTDFAQANGHHFDRVFSFDDERDALEGVNGLDISAITGAVLTGGNATYTDDASVWFDMGLLSKFGKQRADELKKLNQRTHAEMYTQMFGVSDVRPEFFGDRHFQEWATRTYSNRPLVGINPFAGGRWPSKELRGPELRLLISHLLSDGSPFGSETHVLLLGAGDDYTRNQQLLAEFNSPRLSAAFTDDAILRLAAIIGCLDYLITSDSLAAHLGIAQGIPFTAFFAPTSAVEIDTWGYGRAVVSTAADYCSYRKDADNSSINAERIIDTVTRHWRGRMEASLANA